MLLRRIAVKDPVHGGRVSCGHDRGYPIVQREATLDGWQRGIRRGWVVGTLLLLLWFPRNAWTQEARFWDKRGLWAEFIYTIRTWEKVLWTVTPSIRTDEQELNTGFMTRVTTEATVHL